MTSSRSVFNISDDKDDPDKLFNTDYKLFCKYITFENKQQQYDYKRQFKTYSDGKIIKQMFNTILDLEDNNNENNRLITIKDMKIKELENKIKELEKKSLV